MNSNLPSYVSLLFISITVISVLLFHISTGKHRWLLITIIATGILQAQAGYYGFFLKTDALPPRMLFLIAPGIIAILLAFFTKGGRSFIRRIDLERYTYLHTVRIFVEMVLLYLFLHDTLPQTMTFEGRNFDIVAGITAPMVGYFGFRKQVLSKTVLIIWNIACLLLVLQVVITGLFTAPSILQISAFDFPEFAIFYFPFVWLPGIVVPIVIFGHLMTIFRLRSDDSF